DYGSRRLALLCRSALPGAQLVSARGEGGEQAHPEREAQVAEEVALEGEDARQELVGEPGAVLLEVARRLGGWPARPGEPAHGRERGKEERVEVGDLGGRQSGAREERAQRALGVAAAVVAHH